MWHSVQCSHVQLQQGAAAGGATKCSANCLVNHTLPQVTGPGQSLLYPQAAANCCQGQTSDHHTSQCQISDIQTNPVAPAQHESSIAGGLQGWCGDHPSHSAASPTRACFSNSRARFFACTACFSAVLAAVAAASAAVTLMPLSFACSSATSACAAAQCASWHAVSAAVRHLSSS